MEVLCGYLNILPYNDKVPYSKYMHAKPIVHTTRVVLSGFVALLRGGSGLLCKLHLHLLSHDAKRGAGYTLDKSPSSSQD